MKKKSILAAVIVAFGLYSCEPGDAGLENLIESEIDVAGEAAVTSSFEEVDQIVEDGIESCISGVNSSARHKYGKYRFGRLSDCATIDRDTLNQVITIDFGEGCEDHHGVERSGIVRIAYNQLRSVPGAYRIVTFEDFYVDSVGVEGTRTLTNTSDEADSLSRTFTIELVGGKLTFPDESSITRDSEFERTTYISDDWSSVHTTLNGEASGTLIDGTSYTMTIVEEIVFARECRDERVVIPVSGVKEIIAGENVVTIDYGDGTCDNLVNITINGETTTKEIEPKGRRHHRGK
ncbi:hypothetical protein [Marinoscillum pacificum]|uniref:hypothetical protein n=1 Tax=Marinoscillum pacificum TaxID=392723 RepID=UPI0021581AD1|nr:hypothetical protein [Marinoscillum pacificum]